jgi:four helix bundle protein
LEILPGDKNLRRKLKAVSVSSNLAEGSSRASRTDFARFVEIAAGFMFEVVSQAKVSLNQHFLAQPEYDRIISAAEKQCRMLSGLRRSLAQE